MLGRIGVTPPDSTPSDACMTRVIHIGFHIFKTVPSEPSPTMSSRANGGAGTPRVAICPHISVAHYRGGEKWAATLANRLVSDGVDVAVHALPYTPGGERRVAVSDVLDERIPYREAWRHDLSGYGTAYIFYMPFADLFFGGAPYSIAGIHSWVYISEQLFESHYGIVPTAVKVLYRAFGGTDLRRFDAVHTVTPAFDSPHPKTTHIPNFVDTDLFHPDRADDAAEFTVLVTAAHIPEKGWDTVRALAPRLPEEITLAATGTSEAAAIDDLGFLDEEELATAYSRAHVVLHPARVDTDSMVINEACAAGTPVVTTPLRTHVRENESVLHCESADEMLGAIARLHREWKRGDGFETRCRTARATAENHSFDAVYDRLKSLLLTPQEDHP